MKLHRQLQMVLLPTLLLLSCSLCAMAQGTDNLWTRTAGGTAGGDDHIKATSVDANGNVYVLGAYTGQVTLGGQVLQGGYDQKFIAKLNSSGQLQWIRQLIGGTVIIYSLAVDSEGDGVYLAGEFGSYEGAVDFNGGGTFPLARTAVNGANLFVAKYDKGDGNSRWVSTMAPPSGLAHFFQNSAAALAVNSQGVFVTGHFKGSLDVNAEGEAVVLSSPAAYEAPFLAAYHPSTGTNLWAKVFKSHTTGGGRGYDLKASATAVFLTGNFFGTVDFNPGGAPSERSTTGNSAFVARYAPADGRNEWVVQPASSQAASYGHRLALSGDHLYLAATFNGTATFPSGTMTSRRSQDIFLVDYSAASGAFRWVQTVSGQDPGEARTDYTSHQALAADANGAYLAGFFYGSGTFGTGATAQTKTSNGGTDLFVSHFSAASGQVSWIKTLGGAGNEKAQALAVSAAGLHIAGNFSGTVNFDPAGAILKTSPQNADLFVAAYDPELESNRWTVHGEGGTGGHDSASAMARDAAGNTYVTGFFQGSAVFGHLTVEAAVPGEAHSDAAVRYSAYLAKYNPEGEVQWVKPLTGTGNVEGTGIAVAGESLYVTGQFSGEVDFNPGGSPLVKVSVNMETPTGYPVDAFLAKYSLADGNAAWVKTLTADTFADYTYGTGVAAYGEQVYMTGTYAGSIKWEGSPLRQSAGLEDVFLLQLSNNGEMQWLRSVGGTASAVAGQVGANAQGVYLTGSFQGQANFNIGGTQPQLVNSLWGRRSLFVASYGPAGKSAWVKRAGEGTTLTHGYALALDEGAVYVGGSFENLAELLTQDGNNIIRVDNPGDADGIIAKLDATDGDAVWVKSLASGSGSTASTSAVYGLAVDGERVYATGYFEGSADFNHTGYLMTNGPHTGELPIVQASAGKGDAFLAGYRKTDGRLLWVNTVGDAAEQYGNAVVTDAAGVHMAGGFYGVVDFNRSGSLPAVHTAKGLASDVFIARYRQKPSYKVEVAPVTLVYGGTLSLQATTDAPGPVAYQVVEQDNETFTGKAILEGNQLEALKAGRIRLKATVAGDDRYHAGVAQLDVVIGKKELTVTARDQARPFGAPNPVQALSYSGFVAPDTESSLRVRPVATTEATEESPVGQYPIIVAGGDDDNYSFHYTQGTLTVAPLTGSEGETPLPPFFVYPNPTAGRLYVPLTEEALVQVLSITGRVLYTKIFPAGTQALELHQLPQGQYFLKVTSASHSVVKPLVKQ